MTLEILGLAGLLLLSGFFSSSELAYIVANKLKVELGARKNRLAAKYAHFFINKPQTFFSTILISNNIINIAFASLITIFLLNRDYKFSELEILLISTTLLLFFGELIPKYMAREFADTLILVSAIPLKFLSVILAPVVKLTDSISLLITHRNNLPEDKNDEVHKDEIHSLIEEGSELGDVDEEDSDIIKNIIELGDQKIYEAMTPRTDIVGVSFDTSINETLDIFIQSGYSKLPIYEDNLDKIIGIVHVHDLFSNPEKLKDIIREVTFVPETKKSLDMLREFLDKRISFTIVVDEFGGTAGIVTIEDIIEEMLGEIRDEYDDDPDLCKKLDDNTFVLSGKVEIDYLNEEYSLSIPDGDYETIAGFITSKIGRIPTKGEKIKLDDYHIVILHSTNIKINLLKLFYYPPKEN